MSKMQGQELISVVIVAKNEQKIIKACVENVMTLTYGNKEIIVIDNGSTDRMPEILSAFKGIKIIRTLGTLGSARNVGWKAAKGKFICFVDADNLLPEDYLQKMLTNYKEGVGIIGSRHVAMKKGFFSSSYDLSLHLTKRLYITRRGQPRAVGASGAIFLREALERVGGFDDVMFGEDGRFCVKARQMGYRIAYTSNTFNYHDFPSNFIIWRKKCMKGGTCPHGLRR